MGIEPYRLEAVAHLWFAQVFEINTKALAVGKLGVVLPLPGEIGIDLDAVADVADEDERRPTMRGRQGAGVFLRLPLGVEHQDVPGAARTPAAAINWLVGSK